MMYVLLFLIMRMNLLHLLVYDYCYIWLCIVVSNYEDEFVAFPQV